MPLRHNVIRQTQPQTRSLPSRFGRKKRLKDFVADGFGDAVVLDFDDDLSVAPSVPIVSIGKLRRPGKRHKTRVHLVEKSVRCACIHPIGFRLVG